MHKYIFPVIFLIEFMILFHVTFDSFGWSILNFKGPLLTEEDLAYVKETNKRPSITIPEEGLEFYNDWHCLRSKSVTISVSEIDYDGLKKSPTINSLFEKKNTEYHIDPDVNWQVDKIISYWKKLLKGSDEICILSVFLQSSPEGDIRYIERIKTRNGIWDRGDDQFTIEEI
jgi:hypothetical protein